MRFACFDLSSGNPGARVDRAIAAFVARAPAVSLEVSIVPPPAIETGLTEHRYAGFGFDSPNLHAGQRLRLRTSARVQSEEALAVLILSGRYLGFLPSHVAEPFVVAGRMRILLPGSTHHVSTMAAITRRRPAPGRCATLFVEALVEAHGVAGR